MSRFAEFIRAYRQVRGAGVLGVAITLGVTITPVFATPIPMYIITDLGTLPGGTFSRAYDVSDNGLITGYGNTANGDRHPFVWDVGKGFTVLGVAVEPGASESINNNGQVAGYFTTTKGNWHAFVTDASGRVTDLGTLGGTFSEADGINDSGQAAGVSSTSSGELHVFAGDASGLNDLGTLGGAGVGVGGINDRGEVAGTAGAPDGEMHAFIGDVTNGLTDLGKLNGAITGINNSGRLVGGRSTANGYSHAFVGDAHGFTDLGTLSGTDASFGTDINDSGQVVGWARKFTDGGSFSDRAFVSDTNGHLYDLNNRVVNKNGGEILEAEGINDNGDIVGTGFTGSGATRAFLLTPIAPADVGTPPLGETPTGVLGPEDFLFPIKGYQKVDLTTEALTGLSAIPGGVTLCGGGTGYYDPCHDGVYALDFDLASGNAHDKDTIVAAKAGVIVDNGRRAIDENGNPVGTTGYIVIRHEDGYYTVYGDPGTIAIRNGLDVGEEVAAGEPIGYLEGGPGTHLHFQVRYDLHGSGLRTGFSEKGTPALAGVTVGGKKMAAYQLESDPSGDVYVNGKLHHGEPEPTLIGGETIPVYPVSHDSSKYGFQFVIGTLGLGYSEPIYVDPLVAIGYDFQSTHGPLFASVVLPDIGDGLFDLFRWDSLADGWRFSDQVHAGVLYSFGSSGLDRFRIMGIDASVGLGPSDLLAFPVGLTFLSMGPVDFTMAPITRRVSTAVPEPGSLPMFAIGMVILILMLRRRTTTVNGGSLSFSVVDFHD